MKKILLLNPPSEIPCYRILHRAKIGDPNYLWPLVDLIYLSGYLHDAGFSIEHKDFQIDKNDSMEAFLSGKKYDVIVSTYSPFFEDKDLALLRDIKSRSAATDIILLANHKDRLDNQHSEKILKENPFIKALVYDYAYNSSAAFISGDRSDGLFNVFYIENGALKGRIKDMPPEFEIPLPRHEVFKSNSYFHYDSVGGLLTTAMSTFGCKMGCAFCWAPQLYPIVARRTPENLIAEMEHIVKCGISEVYFHDFSFAYHKNQLLRFCQLMVEKNIKLRWFCSSRFDLMSAETIEAMAKAGCRCIEFGLESGNYEVRKLYGKKFPDEKVREVVGLCRKHGIHKSVFIILGLPEESLDDMVRSVEFVKKLHFDYISINILWAERFTDIADKLQGNIITESSDEAMKKINFQHSLVSSDDIIALYNKSIRSIYLNPLFILRQLMGIRSFKKILFSLYLVKKLFFKKTQAKNASVT
ncbi:MAG: radical SAM protein [Elusimicrobiota bacterium]